MQTKIEFGDLSKSGRGAVIDAKYQVIGCLAQWGFVKPGLDAHDKALEQALTDYLMACNQELGCPF